MATILQLQDVRTFYGRIQALKGISLAVEEGQIVALLGANGAGKTTTLRTISGLLPPAAGVIEFRGQRLNGRAAERIVADGIAQSPEGRQVFADLSVQENLKMGAYTRRDKGRIKGDLDRVIGYFPILGQRQKQLAGTLSGGEQQMLAIGRALMAKPQLLLLDEPSLGLAPLIVREIFSIIATINREEGVTILLVEQNANMALAAADYGYVLETGTLSLAGPAADLRQDDAVRRSYLGH